MKFVLGACLFLNLQLIWGQYTLIPDPDFEDLLVQQGIDTDGEVNGQVLTSDISDETILDIMDRPLMQDLTGIQDFSSLEGLYINSADINQIDLSQNDLLRYLVLVDISLSGLDVSNNLNLEQFVIGLNFPDGDFTGTLSEIDLTNNINLVEVGISYTMIESLDLSQNNQLLTARLNQLDELNQLNLKNGNNVNIVLVEVNAPNLVCFQVDDPQAVIDGVDPPYNNWDIQGNPLISEDCFVLGADEFKLTFSILPNPTSGQLFIEFTETPDNIFIYDMSGRIISSALVESGQMDVSFLSPGVYLLSFDFNGKLFTKQVVKR